MNVYADDALVERLTREVVATGKRLLQVHRLADTDHAHVSALLDIFDPPKGATILDIGCGIGEVSRLMKEKRPDLQFILLNISPAQLGMCPDLPRVAGDMNAIPLEAASVDGAMVIYSLGHCELPSLFSEVARVLKPRGLLFIYDLASTGGEALRQSLGYSSYMPMEILKMAGLYRLGCVNSADLGQLNCDDYDLFGGRDEFGRLFQNVWPIALCFKKG